jgi:filamentous hemagglutinin
LAGTNNLPPPITVLNKDGLEKGIRYTIKTPDGNFTLRDFATSNTQVTGGKSWTIDVPKNSPLREQIGEEIKFAR